MAWQTPTRDSERQIVAIGFLTEADLRALGPQFGRAFPIDHTPMFAELLKAIDVADHETVVARH